MLRGDCCVETSVYCWYNLYAAMSCIFTAVLSLLCKLRWDCWYRDIVIYVAFNLLLVYVLLSYILSWYTLPSIYFNLLLTLIRSHTFAWRHLRGDCWLRVDFKNAPHFWKDRSVVLHLDIIMIQVYIYTEKTWERRLFWLENGVYFNQT